MCNLIQKTILRLITLDEILICKKLHSVWLISKPLAIQVGLHNIVMVFFLKLWGMKTLQQHAPFAVHN